MLLGSQGIVVKCTAAIFFPTVNWIDSSCNLVRLACSSTFDLGLTDNTRFEEKTDKFGKNLKNTNKVLFTERLASAVTPNVLLPLMIYHRSH